VRQREGQVPAPPGEGIRAKAYEPHAFRLDASGAEDADLVTSAGKPPGEIEGIALGASFLGIEVVYREADLHLLSLRMDEGPEEGGHARLPMARRES